MRLVAFLSFLMGVLLITSCCCLMKKNGNFTQKDSGSVFNSSKGGVIEISLRSNPTTGYTWNIAEYDQKVLKLEGTVFKQDSDLIGAGGSETFKFSVVGKGKTKLIIQYNRVWEKDVKPAEIFKLTVNSK